MALLDRTDDPEQAPPKGAAPIRRLALVALMCLVLGGIGGVFAATATRPEPAAARFIPPRQQAYDFSLRNQDGRRTSLADGRGKVIAMTFIYATCRDLCPAEGSDIAQAMRMVGGRGVEAYVISVDPIGDTPQRVRDWLNRRAFPAGAGQYLIGTRDELRPVWIHYGIAPLQASRKEAEAAAAGADAFFTANPQYNQPQTQPFHYEVPPQPTTTPSGADDAYPDPADLAYRGRARHVAGWDFEHSAYVLLIDKHGTQRLGIPFEALEPRSLARDLRALLAEP
ncbi:SCO family protein [Solirubrobacter ginsenosidimutans]|uniref:SCO family protein n=1 Tax=Solirubrobacter ginsenosidimutans TaxID=490573 RepID=A0A9X3S0W6_9ACTN|nr:SCO family protein [Solirubrobacter ginsenosidimutans]MDA0161744.1 SCO family protein [Solirubrobacter ginsenosidimutans]